MTNNAAFKFVCPECGGHKVLELVDCSWCAAEIIDVDTDTGELVYGPSEVQGEVYDLKYVCASCHYVLEDVETPEDFVNWLKNSKQNGK